MTLSVVSRILRIAPVTLGLVKSPTTSVVGTCEYNEIPLGDYALYWQLNLRTYLLGKKHSTYYYKDLTDMISILKELKIYN